MYRGLRWLSLLVTMLGLGRQAMALTTASITVNGAEQSGDANAITVAFNGYVETVHYGQYSTAASVASTFGALFSRDYLKAGLCAHAVGNVITFQLRGAATFGAVDITGSTASFALSPSGFLSSGSGVVDTGTVTLSINGSVIASTDYGAESTTETIADGLAESASSSLVSVTAIGNTLRIDAATPGAASDNISYSVQNASFNSSSFSNPSFPTSTIAGNLQGGADAGAGNASTVYQYSASYDALGNLTAMNDSVMGAWTFGYDTLNRLTSGIPGTGNTVTSGLNLCWSYDAFGNRTAQSEQSSTCPATETSLTPTATFNTNNQVTFVANVAPLGYGYDAGGDVANDNVNQYLYDGDGRICAVANTPVPGMTTMTGYIYDAEGSRVAKGKITAWSCDPSINGFETSTEHDYILGPSGEQITEMAASGSSMTWQHTNVWAGGKLIATYDGTGKGLHFYLDDPLGTRRAQTDYVGNWEQSCSSLPYGDALTCSDSVDGPTEHQFTSKQYDSESGNYFFEARYYNPGVARFLSPDWSAKAEPVPYAKLDDPQTLNLYAYVLNNPLSSTDPDGHALLSDYLQKIGNNFKYGEFVTNAQLPAAFASERSWLIQNAAVNQAGVNALRGASNQQINQLFNDYRGQIASALGKFGQPLAVDPRNYSFVTGSLAAYTGGKTSGILRTAKGDFELQSGYDGPAASIPRGTRGFDLITKSHVEGHASAIMRQQGISEGTLEINNPEICSSCMRLLPRMLPPGATLTVTPGEGEPVTFEGLP